LLWSPASDPFLPPLPPSLTSPLPHLIPILHPTHTYNSPPPPSSSLPFFVYTCYTPPPPPTTHREALHGWLDARIWPGSSAPGEVRAARSPPGPGYKGNDPADGRTNPPSGRRRVADSPASRSRRSVERRCSSGLGSHSLRSSRPMAAIRNEGVRQFGSLPARRERQDARTSRGPMVTPAGCRRRRNPQMKPGFAVLCRLRTTLSKEMFQSLIMPALSAHAAGSGTACWRRSSATDDRHVDHRVLETPAASPPPGRADLGCSAVMDVLDSSTSVGIFHNWIGSAEAREDSISADL